MNCPYCGEPMEKGNIYSANRLREMAWYPEGTEEKYKKLLSPKYTAQTQGIYICRSRFKGWGTRKEAYVCRKCEKCVFDLEKIDHLELENKYLW